MKRIILITSHFPYIGGEQFLETEIKYYKDIEVIILPLKKNSKRRDLPKNITVDDYIAENILKKSKFYYLLKSLKDRVFYKELASERWIPIKKLKIFLSSIYSYEMYKEILNNYFSKFDDLDKVLVYTYWNNGVTYALQTLKIKYGYKLVSRIHGGDLCIEKESLIIICR